MTAAEVAIVGAGPAGLACARALLARHRTCTVLERSRGVGGRCATRRVLGQPVDHGLAFLHGSDPEFLAAIDAISGASRLEGWPRRVDGDGVPCQPEAFDARERRMAYVEGVTAFPKALAIGVDVQFETEATSLTEVRGAVRIGMQDGRAIDAASVVLALPAPVSRRLLAALWSAGRELDAIRNLLDLVGTQACLTWLAGYPRDVPRPPWDVLYPEGSNVVQMVSQDSTKRLGPEFVVFVVQARPCWSLANLERAGDDWGAEIARELGRLVGAWAARPLWSQTHRWRFARSDRGSELTRPLLLRLPLGGRVVITGESFAPGGGVEAAWRAGHAGAQRLIEEE